MSAHSNMKSQPQTTEISPKGSFDLSPGAIKEARVKLKMSQKEFAKALGLSRAKSISEYENGRRTPRPYLALAIKQLLSK